MTSLPPGVVYEQLCLSYRAIDDFRTKLLGFLPLVSGGGITVLVGGSWEAGRGLLTPMGIFGATITAGLLAYELHGIRKCCALIRCGRQLEQVMQPVRSGQFTARSDDSVLGKVTAAAVVYPAVFAAWSYLALIPVSRPVGAVLSVVLVVVGFIGVRRYGRTHLP